MKSVTLWSALFRGRHLAYTLLLTLSIGIHALGLHMLATVLPSIVADLGGAAFYAWATLLYTIASIIGTVCGGLVTVWLDLRRGYLLGALVLLGGSLGCATAPHIAVLLLARTLQGLGSGLLVAIAYSMVSELYTDALRARVLSAISGMWGVAALLGPMVGGMFAASGWWRGVFWSTAPVLLPLSILAWYILPSGDIQRTSGPVPLLRLALLGIGVLELIVLTRYASAVQWQHPAAWILLGLLVSLVVAGGYGTLRGWSTRISTLGETRVGSAGRA